MKRILALFTVVALTLCVCAALSSCGLFDDAQTAETQTATDAKTTAAPATTAAPKTTAPETTENGGQTDMSTDQTETAAPATTAAPEATAEPATTAGPATTAAPITTATAAPETTAEPTTTAGPATTAAPTTTATATTEAPVTTEAVVTTAAPVTTEEIVTEHTHVFGAWTEVTAPTCTKAGLEERTCACGETEQRKIARLYHTEPGEDGKCARCGKLLCYEYPMDQVTILNGTIATSSNKFWVLDSYRGAVIDLTDIPFDAVTITRNPEVSEMGYAFLTAIPVEHNEVPSYASGYSKVIWDENETATLGIPSDAKYLYVYYLDVGVIYLPSSVTFFYTEAPRSITIAAWNIGHFSMGGSKNSTIADSSYSAKLLQYQSYINKSLGADVIALAEYSALFTPSHSAAELFSKYTGAAFIGEQRNYSCNALYSKYPLQNVTLHDFACNTPETVLHTTVIKATDYYYITAELPIGDEAVTIVALHLAFNENLYPDTVCTDQMDELIATFADTERVIMLGDWNAYHAEYYDRFAEAGYTVGNDGSFLTCTGSKTGGLEWPVDNIMVKGVTMTDFRTVYTDLSDHVAVIATITLE